MPGKCLDGLGWALGVWAQRFGGVKLSRSSFVFRFCALTRRFKGLHIQVRYRISDLESRGSDFRANTIKVIMKG